MKHWKRSRILASVAALAAAGLSFGASAGGAAPLTSARPATPGVYGAPDWFPLRGSHLIGCSWESTESTYCTVKDKPYHGWPAIDIAGTKGEAVYAAGAGQVVKVQKGKDGNCNANIVEMPGLCPDLSSGNYVKVYHGTLSGRAIYSFSMHLSSVAVTQGDWVDENGPPLGTVGDSGYSTPGFYHLHFERLSVVAPADPINTVPSAGGPAVDPGKLKACVGTSVVQYPPALTRVNGSTVGLPYADWLHLPGHKLKTGSILNPDDPACATPLSGGTGGGPKPKVDLAFAIDTTGSMGPYIDGVKVAANAIADGYFAQADARVALVDYKDLYSSCPSDGYAARVDLPFTADKAQFSAAVAPLVASGGCDIPESVYSGIMKAVGLSWRPGAKKAIIVIGDAPPHDPELTTGYTLSSVLDAAFALDPAQIYTININGGASPGFENLADGSGGLHFLSADPPSVVAKIVDIVNTVVHGLTANAGGPYGGPTNEPLTFDASLSSSAGSNISTFEWDFDGDGVYEVTSPSPSIEHTFTAPFHGDIGLRVTDDSTPAQIAVAATRVDVATDTVTRSRGENEAEVGEPTTLRSSTVDATGLPVVGQSVTFSLGDVSCSAVTNDLGRARCSLIPAAPGGRTTLVVTTAGSDAYLQSSATVDFVVEPAKHDQEIHFKPEEDHEMDKPSFDVDAKASSKLPVGFTSDTPTVCTIGGDAGRTVTALSPGTCSVTAAQPGDTNHNPAPAITHSFTVSLAPQTISFPDLANRSLRKRLLTVRVKSTSKLPVTLTSATPAVCSLAGSDGRSVVLLSAGNCAITATQPGNDRFAAAPSVTHIFTVSRSEQTISFSAISDRTMRKSSFMIRAKSSSHLVVLLTSTTPAVCTIDALGTQTLTVHDAGRCTIKASQTGDASWSTAADVVQSFIVSK